MKTNQCDIGLIGLAVMGENLVLNMETEAFRVAVYQPHHRSDGKIRRRSLAKGKILPAKTMEEFVGALQGRAR